MIISWISLKKKKYSYAMRWFRKQIRLFCNLTGKNISGEHTLIYGVEEDKEDNHDEDKVLFETADELEIDLQNNDVQRVHRLRQERRNKEKPCPTTVRFVSYKKRNEFLTNKGDLKNVGGRQRCKFNAHTAVFSFVKSKARLRQNWCRRRGCRGGNRTPKSFDLMKIRAKSEEIWAKYV